MKIINRTGVEIHCRTYESTKWYDIVPSSDRYIAADNFAFELNPGHSSVYLGINFMTAPAGLYAWGGALASPQMFGPFPDSTQILVRVLNDTLVAIDLEAVLNKWKGLSGGSAGGAQDVPTVLSTGISTATALIVAVATGIAATGPQGALPSGVLLGVGSLLLMAIGGIEKQPPAPPDISAISGAVKKVVTEALHVDYAEQASTVLLLATKWYMEEAQTAYTAKGSTPPFGSINAVEEEKVRTQLTVYAAPSSDFQTRLYHLINHPDIAKFILPIFATGLATYVQIMWLDTCVKFMDSFRKVPGYSIPVDDVSKLRDKIDSCTQGLEKARDALIDYIDAQTDDAQLGGVDEGFQMLPVITHALTGKDDWGFVNEALKKFSSISGSLTLDIRNMQAGKLPDYVWKQAWTAAAKGTPPAASANAK